MPVRVKRGIIILKINTEMEIAQVYARRPNRIYAVEKWGFFHFVITLGYPFCTNFLQTFHNFYFAVMC